MPRKKKQEFVQGQASLWKRMAAFVADLLVINIIVSFSLQDLIQKIVPQDLGFGEMAVFLESNPELASYLTAITVFIGIMALIYFSVMELKLGKTIGKMLMNISVVSETKENKYWQFVVRSLFVIPVMPFILLWIVDPLYMLFDKEGRRLTEKLSKTKVVEAYKVV